jgi:hypothetical protein
MNTPVDFMGRTLRAGQVAAYPVRKGSDMWMNKINITQVNEESIVGYNPAGRLLTIKNLKNVVIVTDVPA